MSNIVVQKRSVIDVPKVNWRIYYDGSGKIVACAPTKIDEIEGTHKHIYINAELGSKIISGKKRYEDLQVVQVGESMQIIDLSEKPTTEITPTLSMSVHNIRFNEIPVIRDTDLFLIGVTFMYDTRKIFFHANQRKRAKILDDIRLGELPDEIRVYVTKKNDPSWLIQEINLSLYDIAIQDMVIFDIEYDELEDVGVFSDTILDGLVLFSSETTKEDIYFYEFIEDLNVSTELSLVSNRHVDGLDKSIFNVFYEGQTLIIGMKPEFKRIIERYTYNDFKFRNLLTLYFVHRNRPYILDDFTTIKIADMITNDIIIPLDRNVHIHVDMRNAGTYFRYEKTKFDRIKDFSKDCRIVSRPEALNPTNAKRSSLFVVAKAGKKITIGINSDYRSLVQADLGVQELAKKFSGYVIGDTVKEFDFKISDIMLTPRIIDVEDMEEFKIYIDLHDASKYFYINY